MEIDRGLDCPQIEEYSKKSKKKRVFLTFVFNFDNFRSLCLFWAILMQKLNSFICKKSFWHPWDSWGRVNSGVNGFWGHTATVYHQGPIGIRMLLQKNVSPIVYYLETVVYSIDAQDKVHWVLMLFPKFSSWSPCPVHSTKLRFYKILSGVNL